LANVQRSILIRTGSENFALSDSYGYRLLVNPLRYLSKQST